MNLLAIDASSDNVSFSILWQDKLIADYNRRIRFGASKFISLIDRSLKERHADLGKIDLFIIGKGPGSFTGLRISFSIVKAFGASLDKPAISVGSFYSCAFPLIKLKRKIAVVSDARRDMIYAASFNTKNKTLRCEGKEKLTTIDEFVRQKSDYFFITYDAHLREKILHLYPDIDFYPKDVWPKARYLIELAKNYSHKDFVSTAGLRPLYLHPKTCQVRKKL